jgi:hypothetical protein
MGTEKDQGAKLLRTRGPNHNWIERYPENPKAVKHREERLHNLRPLPALTKKDARILSAMAELKARLEHRATYQRGPDRPYRGASAQTLNNIIKGLA